MIAVDGATGYLGNHVVAELCRIGVAVRCIVHPGARERDIEFLRSIGAEIHTANLNIADTGLRTALSGCDAVIHLVGSIAPKKGERLSDLHGGQTRALVDVARSCSVSKIVQVTAAGTSANAASEYHRTKWQAEEIVRGSGLRFVILRPSLIIGRKTGNRDSKLIARYKELIRTRPAVPVIGGGHNKVQPVFVEDLAKALSLAAIDQRFDGQTIAIGGPEVLTMRQIVEKLMNLCGQHKAIRSLPPLAARLAAGVLQLVQDVPLISQDQVTLATIDNVCPDNGLQSIFGITPTSVDQALASYNRAEPAEPQAAVG
jgi:NADH dehydrogenase